MQVGMTKYQSLYNKPLTAVHPGALAAGILPQYNTIQYNTIIVCTIEMQSETNSSEQLCFVYFFREKLASR